MFPNTQPIKTVFENPDDLCEIVNGMSVDVEEYFQVQALSERISRPQWSTFPHRVEASVTRILELFDQFETRATFFVLGWIAKRHPDLVREISKHGHEVASHGWEHKPADQQTRLEFREDILRSKKLLEDIAGVPVIGYRAASFSINSTNLWAFDELENCGYLYSSSIYPIRHDIYGMPDAPRFPFFTGKSGTMIEWPGTTLDLAGMRLPCGGGGFFRIVPYRLFRWALRRVRAVDHQPCLFYFHPWEIDPMQPRIRGLSLKSRLRHYANLHKTEPRLRLLLEDFQWDRFDKLLQLS